MLVVLFIMVCILVLWVLFLDTGYFRLIDRITVIEKSDMIQDDAIDDLYEEVFPDDFICDDCIDAQMAGKIQSKSLREGKKKCLTNKE